MTLTLVKPTRIYEFGRQPNGNPVLYLKAAKLRKNIRQEGDAITASEIKEWFEKYKIPAQSEDLSDFLADLNLIRVTVPPREAMPESYPLKTTQKALQDLEASLPLAIAETKVALTSDETLGSPKLKSRSRRSFGNWSDYKGPLLELERRFRTTLRRYTANGRFGMMTHFLLPIAYAP